MGWRMRRRRLLEAAGMLGGARWYNHTLTLQPDATAGVDSSIESDVIDYGSSLLSTIVSGGTATAPHKYRGLLKFDLSSIPAGAKITSAVVSLYFESEADTTDRTVGMHRALTQWYEGEATGVPAAGVDASVWAFRNYKGSVAWAGEAGGGAGSDYVAAATDSKVCDSPSKALDYNVTADVQAFADGTATNYGWWLINTEESTQNSRKRFTSSDGATATNRPKIVVNYKTRNP